MHHFIQIIVSFVVSGFAFPVVAHWTHFPVGWLKMQNFTDFAGAGVLHIVSSEFFNFNASISNSFSFTKI